MCQRTFYVCYCLTVCQCTLTVSGLLTDFFFITPRGILKCATVQTCCNLFLYFVTVGGQKKSLLSCGSGISMHPWDLKKRLWCPFSASNVPHRRRMQFARNQIQRVFFFFFFFFLHRGVTFRNDDTVEMNEKPVSCMLPSMCWLQDD